MSVAIFHAREIDCVLHLLAQLDVIVRDPNSSLPSRQRLVLVPSRLEKSTVLYSPPLHFSTACYYCRRLTYADPHRRFPLGLMALLACWLAPLTESRRADDFAQLQIHLRLACLQTPQRSSDHSMSADALSSSSVTGSSGPTHAYLCLDSSFSSLDLIVWGDCAADVRRHAVSVNIAVPQLLAVLNGHGTGVQMVKDNEEEKDGRSARRSPGFVVVLFVGLVLVLIVVIGLLLWLLPSDCSGVLSRVCDVRAEPRPCSRVPRV